KGFCQSQIIIKTIPLTLLRPNTPMISFALEYRKNQIGFEYEGDYTAILECDNRNEIWEVFIGRDILSDQMDIFLKNFSFNGTISARVKDDCSFIILASDEFISPSGETISIASGTGNSEGENLLINLNTSFDSNCMLKLVKK
ncbi:MAG: hypothetical protein CNC91_03825, partial [Flavobacteriales bacterium MED-G22]